MRLNSLTWLEPRPFRPAMPRRITSLAPSTRPDDLVPAIVTDAAAARVVFRNRRRDRWVMTDPFGGTGANGRVSGILYLYPVQGRAASSSHFVAANFQRAETAPLTRRDLR